MKKVILFFVITANTNIAGAQFEFKTEEIIRCYTPRGEQTAEQKAAGLALSSIISANDVEEKGVCLGWTNAGNASEWHTISSESGVISVDVLDNELLGQWPIKTWPYLSTNSEIVRIYKLLGFPLDGLNEMFYGGGHGVFGIGCLAKKPLRYGKLSRLQKKNDLFLLMGTEFVVFSTTFKRIIFAERYNQSDWVNDNDADAIELIREPEHQYVSAIFGGATGFPYRGTRAYSKLFAGDFNDNGHKDILIWRKTYQSNKVDDPVEGFTIMRNEWKHFEQNLEDQLNNQGGITGEYLPQITAESTVAGWISENNLTWVDGFPNTSECEGDNEGLIQEMHDPRLNDPEVLSNN